MRPHVASALLPAAGFLASVVTGYAAEPSKPPFTVTNDPVHGTVVDTVQQRTCTGTAAQPRCRPLMDRPRVQAIFASC